MNLLHTIGLMTRAEHEAALAKADNAAYNAWIKVINERDFYVSEYKELEAKFKRAATDLAAQADEIAALKRRAENAEARGLGFEKLNLALIEEANSLRPDAEAMRRKRAADRKRMAGKRNG